MLRNGWVYQFRIGKGEVYKKDIPFKVKVMAFQQPGLD
jgi:hypothetical protein